MAVSDATKPLDELLEPGSTLMVGTKSTSGELDFRPLTVARVRGPQVQILIDTTADWAGQLAQGDRAWVTMSDTRSNTWLSMDGRTSISHDPALIDELWNTFADAYFDNGRESPGIGVLEIDADRGTYWTSPSGRIGSVVSFVRAKLGSGEDSGEHGELAV
jgi:general stress protein 26